MGLETALQCIINSILDAINNLSFTLLHAIV